MRIHVSDLNQHSFCPRSIYLSKVLEVEPKPSFERTKKILGHAIRKELSLRQAKLLEKVKDPQEIKPLLLQELEGIIEDIPHIYQELPSIDSEVISHIRPQILKEIDLMEEKLSLMVQEVGIEEALKKITPWKVEFSIRSDKLKLSGRVDKIMKENETYIPIEIKTGEPAETVWKGDRLQTCAYAMLLEDKFQAEIPYGFVEYTKIQEKRPVLTSEHLRRKVLYIRDEIIAILEEEKIPEICPHGNEKKCQSCDFEEECHKA